MQTLNIIFNYSPSYLMLRSAFIKKLVIYDLQVFRNILIL